MGLTTEATSGFSSRSPFVPSSSSRFRSGTSGSGSGGPSLGVGPPSTRLSLTLREAIPQSDAARSPLRRFGVFLLRFSLPTELDTSWELGNWAGWLRGVHLYTRVLVRVQNGGRVLVSLLS